MLLELIPETDLQVEIMHLYLYRGGDMAIYNSDTASCLGKNIHLCSATLMELYLDRLDLEHCFSELSNCAGSACSDLKVMAQLQRLV